MTKKATAVTQAEENQNRHKSLRPVPDAILREWEAVYEKIGERIQAERNLIREKLQKAVAEFA